MLLTMHRVMTTTADGGGLLIGVKDQQGGAMFTVDLFVSFNSRFSLSRRFSACCGNAMFNKDNHSLLLKAKASLKTVEDPTLANTYRDFASVIRV